MGRWTSGLITCVSLLLVTPAIAEVRPDLDTLREERDETVERSFLRALTQKRFNTAVELLESGEYAEAREKLEGMKFARMNPYERALAYRYLAHVSMNLEDPAAAVAYFEKVLEQEALPIDDETSIRYNLAQIYAAMEEWQKVQEQLLDWFQYEEQPNSVAYYLLAIAYYRLERPDDALPPALKALELTNDPNESWLQLVAALYLQKEDFDSAVPILEEMVSRFAKKQHWVQLSLIYSARGDYEHAMEIQQLAYAQGLLTEDDELRRLARTYLFRQLPYPAAELLERGLAEGRLEQDREVLELLGNSWIAAREYDKSIEPLQQAAEMADDGRLYLRLGQVRIQSEDWDKATGLIQKAIEKGGLADAGRAHLLLGISFYSDDHPDSARMAFMRAQQHESTRTEATAWLAHIERQNSQEG